MLELSTAEQKIIEFAREEFGEFITRFLLAGLGEENVGLGWQFTITYAGGEGITLEREVHAFSHELEDGLAPLPRQRNPLVLLALLQLLVGDGQSPGNSLLYNLGDILNLLGWRDSQGARDEIDEAVQRYFLLTFRWKMNRVELVRNDLSHYTVMERIISEYGTIDLEEEGRVKRASNRVAFSSTFIQHLRCRSLFEIDWNGVSSVTQISQH